MPIDPAQGFVEPLKDGREPTRKNMSRPEYRDETELTRVADMTESEHNPKGKRLSTINPKEYTLV